MAMRPDINWQPSLFAAAAEPAVDEDFGTLERVQLDANSWVDHAPEWVSGADALFEHLVGSLSWGQRSRKMYDRTVQEPRLTSLWRASSGDHLDPPILETMRKLLGERYEIDLDSVGFNLYRDGRDSVAWHGDRITKDIERPIVALVSVGEPRRFLMRPKDGGSSKAFSLGRGALLVTGGLSQRTWDHSIPKVAKAGPRISIAFRHGLDRTIVDNAEATSPG